MANRKLSKSERPISKLAIGAARKSANRFSRDAERKQLSIDECLKDIEKLKAKKNSGSSFAVDRRNNDLSVLQNGFSRVMRKYEAAKITLDGYIDHNKALGSNGSN